VIESLVKCVDSKARDRVSVCVLGRPRRARVHLESILQPHIATAMIRQSKTAREKTDRELTKDR
jgi:hypothetical protein